MPAGRPRSLDEEVALESITRQFWREGYDALSLERIATQLGVTKPTVYRAFGDKEAVFARAIDCYYARYGREAERALQETSPFADALRAWFEVTVARILDPETPSGCLITDAVASERFVSGPVAEALERSRTSTLPLLVERIEQAKREGELDAQADTESVVCYLGAQQAALAALSRASPSPERLEDYVSFALFGLLR